MSEELKPCPLCGGEADIKQIGYSYAVFCNKCSASSLYSEKSEAIEAWNRRADNDTNTL